MFKPLYNSVIYPTKTLLILLKSETQESSPYAIRHASLICKIFDLGEEGYYIDVKVIVLKLISNIHPDCDFSQVAIHCSF